MKARPVLTTEDGRIVRSKTVPTSLCGKAKYSSRKLAKAVAAQVRRDTGENISAYKCGPCHCWHIGHTPGLPRRIAS